jgi:hypothetical protein
VRYKAIVLDRVWVIYQELAILRQWFGYVSEDEGERS